MDTIEVYKKLLGDDGGVTPDPTPSQEYLSLENPAIFKVQMVKDVNQSTLTYDYKIGGGNNWTNQNIAFANASNVNDSYIQVPANTRIYFKRSSNTLSNQSNKIHFKVSGNSLALSAFGDTGSLINNAAPSQYCFSGLFKGIPLVHAENSLTGLTLANNCYQAMFSGCTSLTSVEEDLLPASNLAANCYKDMFKGCQSLQAAPKLNATNASFASCYESMFEGCFNLRTAPTQLPATTVGERSYANMFSGCASIQTAPSIKASTVGNLGCYQMFSDCSSLKTVPDLSATTLGTQSYYKMFHTCNGLKTPPNLSATTLAPSCCLEMFEYCITLTSTPILPATNLAESCYEKMFAKCSKLSSVNTNNCNKVLTLQPNCYNSMFQDCTGLSSVPLDFFDQVSETASSCCRNMFINCTALSSVPNFPNTTSVSERCYDSMYKNCTALTTATQLPATNLTPSCYQQMFYNCTALSSISAYFPSWFEDDAPKPPPTSLTSGHFVWIDYNKQIMPFTFFSHGVNKIKIRDQWAWFHWNTGEKIYAPINNCDIWYCKNGQINPNPTGGPYDGPTPDNFGDYYLWRRYHDERYYSDSSNEEYEKFKVNMTALFSKGGAQRWISTDHAIGEVITLQNNDTIAFWNKTPYNNIGNHSYNGFLRVKEGSSINGFIEAIGDIRSLINWNGYNKSTGGGYTLVPNLYPNKYEGGSPENTAPDAYDCFSYTNFHCLLNCGLGANVVARYLKLLPGTRYDYNGGFNSWYETSKFPHYNTGHNPSTYKEYTQTACGWVYTLMCEERKFAHDYMTRGNTPIFGMGDEYTEEIRNFYTNLTGYADDDYYWSVDTTARYTWNWTYNIFTEGQFYKVDQLDEIYNGDNSILTQDSTMTVDVQEYIPAGGTEENSFETIHNTTLAEVKLVIDDNTTKRVIMANGPHFIPSTWIPKEELVEYETNYDEDNNLNIKETGYLNE